MKKVISLGIDITPTNLDQTKEFILSCDYSHPAYVCLPDTSVAAFAERDPKLMAILRDALLTLPDGLPLIAGLRLKGCRNISTVSGYWLVKSLIKTGLTHFFYGASESTCKLLTEKLKAEVPDCRILGYKSPPLADLSNIGQNSNIKEDMAGIRLLKPDIIWIGISSPKQDYLMHHFYQDLEHGIMIGVGGVFDYLAGTHKISPEWIKKTGLRWLYRLIQDPGRLWKKYYRSFVFLFRHMLLLPSNRMRIRKKSCI